VFFYYNTIKPAQLKAGLNLMSDKLVYGQAALVVVPAPF
jgi:hypothetical protein